MSISGLYLIVIGVLGSVTPKFVVFLFLSHRFTVVNFAVSRTNGCRRTFDFCPEESGFFSIEKPALRVFRFISFRWRTLPR